MTYDDLEVWPRREPVPASAAADLVGELTALAAALARLSERVAAQAEAAARLTL